MTIIGPNAVMFAAENHKLLIIAISGPQFDGKMPH